MAKKRVTIEIPIELAELLIAEPEDFKEPSKFDETQKISKAMLKLLVIANRKGD